MKLTGLYSRNLLVSSYINKRIYSCDVILNLNLVILDFMKISDKLFNLSKNLVFIFKNVFIL